MTNSTLDELRALSNKAMQEAQSKADVYRPDTRIPWTKFTADVKVSIETREGERKSGEKWSSKVVCLHLSNGEVLETYRDKPLESYAFSEAALDINWAERAKSALGYTTATIAEYLGDEGASVVEIDGKRVTFEERVVPAPKNSKTGETVKDKSGYPLKPTFYWAVIGIEGAKAAPETDAKAKDAALGFAVGKTKGEFTSGVVGYVKEQGLNVSDTDQLYFISRFLPEMTSAGKLTLDDEKKFVLASL